MGDTQTMTRAARPHQNWHYARRAQRIQLRPAHPDGAVDCVGERSVWFFEKRKISQHRHHCPYGHARFMAAHGAMPPRWFMNPKWAG